VLSDGQVQVISVLTVRPSWCPAPKFKCVNIQFIKGHDQSMVYYKTVNIVKISMKRKCVYDCGSWS